MTNEWIEEKQTKISKMGFYELQDYRDDVIASCLENPSKFFLYDLIADRLEELSKENILAESASLEFDMEDWSER